MERPLIPQPLPWGLDVLAHHVVAVLPDPEAAARAIDALQQAGWRPAEVTHYPGSFVYQSYYAWLRERGLHNRPKQPPHLAVLDINGAYLSEAAKGRSFVTVAAARPEQATQASTILSAHGGYAIGYYGDVSDL